MPSNFPHPLPLQSLPPSWFFFLVGQVGNEKSVSFFFWCLGNLEAISFLLSFSSHSQCSHLLSQGNAVTGTFAQAIAIWWKRRKQKYREKERAWVRLWGCVCNQSTILQTQRSNRADGWQLSQNAGAKWYALKSYDRVRKQKSDEQMTTAARNNLNHYVMLLHFIVLCFFDFFLRSLLSLCFTAFVITNNLGRLSTCAI